MSYEKTAWADGDIISAQRMNNIQNGIEAISNAESENHSPVVYFFLDDLIEQAESENGLSINKFIDVLQNGKSIIVIQREINEASFYNTFYFLESAASNYGSWEFKFVNNYLDVSTNKNLTFNKRVLTFFEESEGIEYISQILFSSFTNNISNVGNETHYSDVLYPSNPIQENV